MLVSVHGLDRAYERAAENVVRLFFEDVNINFTDEWQQTCDIRIAFEQIKAQDPATVSEQGHIQVTITRTEDQHMVTASAALPDRDCADTATAGDDSDEADAHDLALSDQSSAVKYTYCRALLEALEQLTGMSQPWGVLTGIRPTKLVHRHVKEGAESSDISADLTKQYNIQPHKIDLMQRIVRSQHAAIPDLYDLQNEVSIYIGIPYCPTKCAYCTFPAYSIFGRQGDVDSFLSGLHYEMIETGKWLASRGLNITTIYYGGGTPTSITAEEMDRLYEVMSVSFPNVEHVREITVEAGRPDTITPEKLDVLNKWGIDRISINPQSYTQETLQAIGRHHTVEETIEKFHLARQMGMHNINMDLIIGLPGENVSHFKHTLAQTKALMPESLTVHTLSFKKASEMTRNKQKYPVAGRQEIAGMMREAEMWTAANGYHPYYLYRQKNILGNLENVGYALPGKESLYNIIIMEELQTIIGIGCGAASKLVHPVTGKITRLANPKEPRAYNERFAEYTTKKLEALAAIYG